MRVEAFSPWNNCWTRYTKKYFDNTDIKLDWNIGNTVDLQKINGADVFLFGWADQMAVGMTNRYPKLADKYVVFVRSYELFSGIWSKIDWKKVDDVIFISKSFYDEYSCQVPYRTHCMPNAIDLKEWKLPKKQPTKNIAMVANLSHKKGINLIPHFVDTLPEDYSLYIAGREDEYRHMRYVKHMLKVMGLEYRVKFEGHVDNIQEWFKDKSYLFTCSVTEGHPNGVMEAMACGLKPLIHNWAGADDWFDERHIWTSLDEVARMVTQSELNPDEYRKDVEKFDIWNVYPQLKEIICL